MSQPPSFSPSTDFSNEEANGVAGRSTVRTAQVDAQLDAIATTFDAVLANLALLQRDDTRLLDGIVEIHTLSSEVLALMASATFTVRGSWLTATSYAVGDLVTQNAIVYLCMVAHTSGTFATDLAAAKWGAISATPTASSVSFASTSTLSSSNVQAAIQELDTELRPGQSFLNREIFNGL